MATDGCVPNDRVAQAVTQTVGKYDCRKTLADNYDRVTYFKRRMLRTSGGMVIVLLNVDDVHGGPIARTLMSTRYDWQSLRSRENVPYVRGLAVRDDIQKALDSFDKDAATKLQNIGDVAVVVVDHGVAEVFAV